MNENRENYRAFAEAVHAQLPECADVDVEEVEVRLERLAERSKSEMEMVMGTVRRAYEEDVLPKRHGAGSYGVSRYHSAQQLYRELVKRRRNLPNSVREGAEFIDDVPSAQEVESGLAEKVVTVSEVNAKEYRLIDEYIRFLFRQYLEEVEVGDTKKAQIIALKNYFGTKKHPVYEDDLIAEVVGSTRGYVSDFGRNDAGEVVNESKERRGGSIPNYTRRAVRERDSFACVRCGATEDEAKLEAHHIIPAARGGEHDVENLATLCNECHQEAHGGTKMGTSRTVYDSKEEFWNEWIQTNGETQ